MMTRLRHTLVALTLTLVVSAVQAREIHVAVVTDGPAARTFFSAESIEKELANVAAPAAAGDDLYSEDLGDQASGVVVNAEASPDGGHDLLAVVQTASRESSTVHLKSLAGPVLRFSPLPYAVA